MIREFVSKTVLNAKYNNQNWQHKGDAPITPTFVAVIRNVIQVKLAQPAEPIFPIQNFG